MLVLTRKVDQTVRIGDEILIHVSSIKNNQVRLALDVPKDVRVLRGELQDDCRERPDRDAR